MGGAVTVRGRYFSATDQPAKESIASARSGMPCRVTENDRVMSGDLREFTVNCRPHRADPAVFHARNAVGETEDTGVVGDNNDGAIGDYRRLLQDLDHRLAGFGIQRRGWFITHDKLWSVNKGAGDCDTLLFAT